MKYFCNYIYLKIKENGYLISIYIKLFKRVLQEPNLRIIKSAENRLIPLSLLNVTLLSIIKYKIHDTISFKCYIIIHLKLNVFFVSKHPWSFKPGVP